MSRLAGTQTGKRLADAKSGRSKLGSRGKDGEASVREALKALALRFPHFDYERKPDARTAGGRIGRQTGDFGIFFPGGHGVIETKDLDHPYRIPRGRFIKEDKEKGTQNNSLERLMRRQQAGGLVIVLVHHTPSGLWRNVPLDWLHARQGQPSWDLSEFQTYDSPRRALRHLEVDLEGMRDG